MSRRALPAGIFRTAAGYRVFVRVVDAHGRRQLPSKRFPADASLATMKEWREHTKVHARSVPPALEVPEEGFAADAARYLIAVKAMPSYKDRVRQIGEWIALFGTAPRSEVTAAHIRAARDRWLTEGPKRVLAKGADGQRIWIDRKGPLSPSTVNQRLRALENLYTVLDGKHAPNPVRDVPECQEPDPVPRGQSFALALEILRYMPDVTTPKKGALPEPGSLSRVRFEAMLWTGLPAIQLARLTPESVDWTHRTVLVPRRAKGRSSRRAGRRRVERARPLLPQAIDALKRFFALGANRKFSSTSLGRSLRRAIRSANKVRAAKRLPLIPALTVYDLTRHTFGTEAYRATGNLTSVQELMGHSDRTMTERYARAAITEHTVKAIQELGAVADRATRPAKYNRGRPRGRKAAKKGYRRRSS